MNKTNLLRGQPILHLNLRPFFVLGLWLILFSAPFSRGLFFAPELLTAHLLTGVVFALCVYDQVLRREVAFRISGLEWALLALLAAYALSLVAAVHLRPAVGEVLKMLNYLLLYWIAFRAVRTELDLDRVLLVTYAAALGVALIGVGAATGLMDFPGAYVHNKILSTLQYKNTLGIFLVMLSVVGLGLSTKTDRLWVKLLFAAGGALLVTVLLGTHSRASWVLYPFILGGYVALLPEAYRWRAAYHALIQVGSGLLAAKGFFDHLKAGEPTGALWYLGAGIAVAVVLQWLYHLLGIWLNRKTVAESTRRVVAVGGVTYCGLILVFYLSYSAAALPAVGGQVLADDVLVQAGKISTQEPSYQARMDFNRDALRIVRDYPLTGAGGGGWHALYHQYQSYPYWTSEVHNHYYQIWIEAGTIGLAAVLAVWVFFILLLVRLWRHGVRNGLWVSTWAAAVAALTLGVHSAFDFNLSLAAMGFMLWGYMGLVRGGTELALSGKHRNGSGKGRGRSRKEQRPDEAPAVSGRKLAAVALAGTLAAVVLLLPAAALHAAGRIGAEAAQSVKRQELDTAAALYRSAIRRDPFTASYPADLAQIYAAQALAEDDALKRYRALHYAQRAAGLEPHGIPLRTVNLNLYMLLGETRLAVGEAEALVTAHPLQLSTYEALARTSLAAAQQSIARGDREAARAYVQGVLALPERIEQRGERLKDPFRGRWLRAADKSGVLQLAQGQAYFLQGEYEAAETHLQKVSGDEDLRWESALWLAAVYHRTGDGEKALEMVQRLGAQRPEAVELFEEVSSLSLR